MKDRGGRLTPHILFCITTLIVLLGLVTVYSAGSFFGYKKTRDQWEAALKESVAQAADPSKLENGDVDPLEALRKLQEQNVMRRASTLSTFTSQFLWASLGFLALVITAMCDYPTWRTRVLWLLLIVIGVQIALTAIPAGSSFPVRTLLIHGSKSRLSFFGLAIQPSELAKLVLIIFTARFLAKRVEEERMTLGSLIPLVLALTPSIGMILAESDKGVAAHLCISITLLWLFSGGKVLHFIILVILGVVSVGTVIIGNDEARGRVVRFLTGAPADQYQQALEGFARGGMFGTGLGNGEESLTLFGAHNDVILAIVGEELGFITAACVVLSYAAIILLGLRISKSCNDPFGKILALGITILFGTQALLNMAITLDLLPPTGFNLPLLSAGGASMITTMAGIGILINISLSTDYHLLASHNRNKAGSVRVRGAAA